MLIRPELQALRRDDAPQRRAQARLGQAFAAWRAAPVAAAAEAELARFAEGQVLEDLPVLSALFAPGEGAAQEFCGGLVEVILGELSREVLGQSPLRHNTDDTLTTLSIFHHGTATLTLQTIDGQGLSRRPEPTAVSFSPGETWESVLAGEAAADRVTITGLKPGGAILSSTAVRLEAGSVCHRHGLREALVLRRVKASMVTLKLQRRTCAGQVSREYALATGELIHQAAADPRDSRLELSAALLGRMGRRDAAPMLAAMAEEQGSLSLRWQVLRECLALDSAAGFAALCRIARRSDDPLAHAAGSLRAQLIETYPALAKVEPCPL